MLNTCGRKLYNTPRKGGCPTTSESHDTEADRQISFDIDEFRVTETMDWILREGAPNHTIFLCSSCNLGGTAVV
jgi:hypothetical protein